MFEKPNRHTHTSAFQWPKDLSLIVPPIAHQHLLLEFMFAGCGKLQILGFVESRNKRFGEMGGWWWSSISPLVERKERDEEFCVPNTNMGGELLLCKLIYLLFILSTFVCWLLLFFLFTFFSISVLQRLRDASDLILRLHHAGLFALQRHLRQASYVRLAWSDERIFEASSILLCLFVCLSAFLLTLLRGKCYPENVPQLKT